MVTRKNEAEKKARQRGRGTARPHSPGGMTAGIARLLDPATLDPASDFRKRARFLALVDKTADTALRLLADSTGAEEAFLFQRRGDDGGFSLLAGSRAGGKKAARLETIAGEAAEKGRPFFRNRPGASPGKNGTRGFLALPVAAEGRRVSTVIILLDKRPAPLSPAPRFTSSDIMIAAPMSLQAAIGVQSGQLGLAIKNTHLDSIMCLAKAVESRDRKTGEHISRITDYATIIACALELPDEETQLLRYAVPLHDIGKISIPDSILLKPGPLTPGERKIIETHPEAGARILAGSSSVILQAAETVALCHHERFDGQGYPRGLAGENIPLYGRIAAVADAFDAICSDRCYKRASSFDEGTRRLEKDAGGAFDPRLVKLFLENILQR